MASTKLTSLSKILIALFLLAVGYYFYNNSNLFNKGVSDSKDSSESKPWIDLGNKKKSESDVINIGVVTWGGYAGGQYFNRGFDANTNSQFYKDYGFKVNFKVIDDFDASRDAFKNGDIDLMWATIDAFPTEVEGLAKYDPQVVFQADWSRGGDAIVARRGINTVKDLKGKKIAVAPMTPSHSFLIWLLEAGDLTTNDVKIIEVPSAIDAADAFKSNSVDAAVVWSPDDEDAVNKVAGSKVLESTKHASHIIADVFIAKKEFIQNHKKQVQQLYEGWMKGAAELNASDSKKHETAKYLAKGLGMPEDFCYNAINNTRLATHGDNLNFFGLNPNYKGVTGEELYNKMKIKYDNLGYKTANAKSWRLLASKDIVPNVQVDFSGSEAEKEKVFTNVDNKIAKKEALSTKRLSISFRSGEYSLDENAKQLIDLQFVPIAKAFSNTRIRIEGNTDNVGSFGSNVSLSKKRAQSVADYLMQEHGMQKNRIIIIGNGPSKPVEGCESNKGKKCKARNRRTDFELVND